MTRSKIEPISAPKYLRMMMAAPAGFGKTVFAGTAPNALFITTDPEGTASAAAYGSTAQEIQASTQKHLQDAFVDLEGGLIDELGLEYVIVDNLTECQYIFRQHSIDAGVARRPDRSQFVPEQQDYLVAQNATIDLVKKFNTLPVNMIYTCHRKGMEDEGGNDYYSVAIQGGDGQVAQMILGYMNVVGMGDVITIGDPPVQKRRIYFDHVREHRGKDRFVKLGKFKDNLTVPEMMSILYPDGQGVSAPPATRPRPRPKPKS